MGSNIEHKPEPIFKIEAKRLRATTKLEEQ